MARNKFPRKKWLVVAAVFLLVAWAVSVRSRSVHTSSVSAHGVDQGASITCDVINPHSYAVDVVLEASFVSRGSEYEGPSNLAQTTKNVRVDVNSTREVKFLIPRQGSLGAIPQVLVLSVERAE